MVAIQSDNTVKMKKKQVTLRIDESLWNRLKQEAERTATPTIHLVESFCTYGLEHNLSYGVVPADKTTSNTIDVTHTAQEIQAVQERLKALEQKSFGFKLPDDVWEWWWRRVVEKVIQQYEKQSSQDGQEGSSETENDAVLKTSTTVPQKPNMEEVAVNRAKSSVETSQNAHCAGIKEVSAEKPYAVLYPKDYQGTKDFNYGQGMTQREFCTKVELNPDSLTSFRKRIQKKHQLSAPPSAAEALHREFSCIIVKFKNLPKLYAVKYYLND